MSRSCFTRPQTPTTMLAVVEQKINARIRQDEALLRLQTMECC
nr:MAG TPA: hypothetical protein [Caudoviricetes sp.]